MNKIIRSSTMKLGANKGMPRVYIEGKYLDTAGFKPGDRYNIHYANGRVTIERFDEGKYTVSSKKDVPVIDINNPMLTEALSAERLTVSVYNQVISIQPAYTILLVSARQLMPTEGSLFAGGGFLTLAAQRAGFAPQFAVEIDPAFSAIYEANHAGSRMYNMSVSDVPWEELRRFRPLGLLTAGIPCEPYSNIRTLNKGSQEKRDRTLPPEAHELGDMAFWALRAIEASNPHTVVLENVPALLQSGAGYILINTLRRMGYNVDSRVIDPLEYGELTGRKRAVILATTGAPIVWPEPIPATRRLADILEPMEAVKDEWFDRQRKQWLFDHWDKQNSKGNGFASCQIPYDAPHCPTIKKRYFAQQGDNPVLCHPTDPSLFRWFTLTEVKRLHGIPDDYYLGTAKTLAGEAMGQGVLVNLFANIIGTLTKGRIVQPAPMSAAA
jgi:DNA (cytosine-5)-methyltransferase 1